MPVAPPRTGDLTLTQITNMWPAVVELVRGSNAMLASLLAGARPIAVTATDLTLAFPANAAFMKRKVESDEHRRATAEALRNVTGAALVPRYELADEEVLAELAAPVAAPVKTVSGDELVRRFVEEFGAEEIFENEKGPQGPTDLKESAS